MKYLVTRIPENQVTSENETIKTIREAGLFIENGAMIFLSNSEKFSFSRVDLIVSIYDQDKVIGWAAVISGLMPEKKGHFLREYPHVSVFIKESYRGQGLAHKALYKLISAYKTSKWRNRFDSKVMGYSVSPRIFKPVLDHYGIKSKYMKHLKIQEITIEIGD